MEREHSELQQHITRTDWWCENLGHWRATITTAEVRLFFFFVHKQQTAESTNEKLKNQANVKYVAIETFVCKTMLVCVSQATEEGGETVACYSVCVSLVEGEEMTNSRWSVQRKLTEFQMLHRKLTEVTQNTILWMDIFSV